MPLNFDPETHKYTLDGVVLPSVTQVLHGVGLIDFGHIDQLILDRAAALGTAVHAACAYDDMTDLDEDALDDNIRPHLDAWRKFRGTMKFDAIEQSLCHPGYGFAGTPDRVNSDLIIDIKTGSIVPAWVGLQLAAYSILADLPTAKRWAVQLKPDGSFKIYEFKKRTDRSVFLAALSVYQWRMEYGTTSA